jgi:hypothetical protein
LSMDLLYILNSVSKPNQQHTENIRAPSARVLRVKGSGLDLFSDVEQISSHASRDIEVPERSQCTRLTTSSFLPKTSISIQRIREFPKSWIAAWKPFQFKAKIAKGGDSEGNRNVLNSPGMSKSLGARGNLWSTDCYGAQGAPIANSSMLKKGPTDGREGQPSGKTAVMLELKDICG